MLKRFIQDDAAFRVILFLQFVFDGRQRLWHLRPHPNLPLTQWRLRSASLSG
jgi:hypothetical protein